MPHPIRNSNAPAQAIRNEKLKNGPKMAGPYKTKKTDDQVRGFVRPKDHCDGMCEEADQFHHNDQEMRFVGKQYYASSSKMERLLHFKTGKAPLKTEIPAMEMRIADRTKAMETHGAQHDKRAIYKRKLRTPGNQSWNAYNDEYHTKLKFMTRPTLDLSKKLDVEGKHYRHMA